MRMSREEQRGWYEKGKVKGEEVMQRLDPTYHVIIQDSLITPDDKKKEPHRTYTLLFLSRNGPSFSWYMAITPTNEFIENELSTRIKKIYREISG